MPVMKRNGREVRDPAGSPVYEGVGWHVEVDDGIAVGHRRTERWRTLSHELGDEWANALVRHAEAQPDPFAACDAIITVVLSTAEDPTAFVIVERRAKVVAAHALVSGEGWVWPAVPGWLKRYGEP